MTRYATTLFNLETRFIRCRRRACNGPARNGGWVLVALVAAIFNSTALALDHSEHPIRQPEPESLLDEAGEFTSESPNKASTAYSTVPTEKLASDDGNENEEENDGGDDEEEDENQVTSIIEELFLGIVVYPQEQDEVQLTFGYFNGVEAAGNSETVFEIEYGITDRFQVGFEVPTESVEEDIRFDGVRNLGLDFYYNFYSDRTTGRAYGVGFEFGAPVDSAAGESRAFEYMTYVVAYQEYDIFALNVSAALAVEDPLAAQEGTETAGDVAFGLIGKVRKVVPLLEVDVEVASEVTPVRLAPGLYFPSFVGPLDVAISLPIGLNNDAPDFAVYFLAIVEFDARAMRSRIFK